jgi:hypothetical protein
LLLKEGAIHLPRVDRSLPVIVAYDVHQVIRGPLYSSIRICFFVSAIARNDRVLAHHVAIPSVRHGTARAEISAAVLAR